MRLSLVGIVSIASVLGACSSAPIANTPASAPAPAPAPATSGMASSKTATTPAPAQSSDAEALAARLRQQRADLDAKSVLFDYDDYTVKPGYDDMLKLQAGFMKSDAADHLTLQGNSDERGGAEYNLALGQKRADAVRKALVVLGISDSRIETTSFGKEKPKATCHDESCWSQNRRVDFVHGEKH